MAGVEVETRPVGGLLFEDKAEQVTARRVEAG